ncbi:MAG: peptidylprolyl isomerase [Bacillota bacterium]|nr:peptidylprolyl isomerase [Bacillota bacterium]
MKKLLVALSGILCVFVFAACGEAPVATVNGEDITQEDYTTYMDNLMTIYEANGYELTNDQKVSMKDTVIEELVNQKMVEQAAKELDCYPTDNEVDAYFDEELAATFGDAETGKQTIEDAGVDLEVYRYGYLVTLCRENIGKEEVPESTMTDEEAQAVYDEDPDAYNTRTVSHILIMPDAGDREVETDDSGETIYTDEEWAAAEAKAEDIIAQLDDGSDFATLAQENSDDTASAENGGALEGAFSKTDSSYVEEFTNAAFELTEVGQYSSAPVRSSYGYHIIKVDDLTTDDNMDEVLQQIKEEDLETKRDEAVEEYLSAFEADATIIYYDEDGKEITQDTEEDAADSTDDAAADSEADTGDSTDSADSTDDAAADSNGDTNADNTSE